MIVPWRQGAHPMSSNRLLPQWMCPTWALPKWALPKWALPKWAPLGLAACAVVAATRPGAAEGLGTWGGFDIRLDTTLRFSLGLRTAPANPQLLAKINADDGDRAFGPGLNSERLDIITELTGERGDLGFDVSVQGWYDAAYNMGSANNSPATFNPVTSSNRGFPDAVRTLMGRDAEFLNAYVHDTLKAGDVPLTVSVGRQTLLWGESLLFPENGIAAAQAPVDQIKQLGAPLAEAREVFLPVTQLVIRADLGNGYSLEAYDQFEWRRDRPPAVGSFFSTSDIVGAGGQRFLTADGLPTLYRTADAVPHGIGEFGIALRHTQGMVDWGLYALQADARSPTVIFEPADRTYHLAFPTGIQVYGASLSTYLGDANVAGEISLHHNTPLDFTSGLGAASSLGGGYTGGIVVAPSLYGWHAGKQAALPQATAVTRGTTINAQLSAQVQFAPNRLADGATLQIELAGNQLVSEGVPPDRTRLALGVRAVFTPQFFHVLPGLDLSTPVGFGLGLVGRSAFDASLNAGTGSVSLGVNASFRVVWEGAITYTHFIGGPEYQPLADRDFALVSVTRTF
jgi:hypothetical protein